MFRMRWGNRGTLEKWKSRARYPKIDRLTLVSLTSQTCMQRQEWVSHWGIYTILSWVIPTVQVETWFLLGWRMFLMLDLKEKRNWKVNQKKMGELENSVDYKNTYFMLPTKNSIKLLVGLCQPKSHVLNLGKIFDLPFS